MVPRPRARPPAGAGSRAATASSPTARIQRAITRGMRDPVGIARRMWEARLDAVLTAAAALPAPIRVRISAPFAAALQPLALRNPARPVVPELAYVLRWLAGPPTRASALARGLGTSPRTRPATRRRLARLAAACGSVDVAREIADSMPDDRSGALEVIRGRRALGAGWYSAAIEHARRAGRAAWATETIAISESRLRVLQSDWTPNLGSDGQRLVRLRGRATRGRILHVVSSSLPYRQAGYTLRSQSVARCQREVGLDPRFATRAGFPGFDGIANVPREQVVDGVPYYRLSPDFADPQYDDRLVTETARAAVDLVERLRPAALQPASDFLQARAALAVASALDVPLVYEVRGFLEETWLSHPMHAEESEAMDAERYRLRRQAETRAMREATAVVTLSETMRADIVERGIPADKVVVVPNAVELERFAPLVRDGALAASLGIEPDETVVGYISSFSPYEGIRYLLEAAALLRDRGRRLKVLLVGDGGEWDALVEAGRGLGLAEGTLLMPGRVPHDQVRRYYSIIDVFVVPRTTNRVSQLVTPLKPYEAMAMERAVVVSDVQALREMVVPDETGLIFRAEDSGDLAEVLDRLLDDRPLRERLGRQAREWVSTSRTWSENGRRYRELYERLGVV